MKTSDIYPVVLVALLLSGCARGSPPSDAKLAALQTELDSATTTLGMTEKANAIGRYLDQKMSGVEALVRAEMLDDESRDLFDRAAVAWREYRQAHAELAYSLYGDGSMRGLAFNFAFNKLTEDRLRDLQELRPEAEPGGGAE